MTVDELRETLRPCPICGGRHPTIIEYPHITTKGWVEDGIFKPYRTKWSADGTRIPTDSAEEPDRPVQESDYTTGYALACMDQTDIRYCGLKTDAMLDLETLEWSVNQWNLASQARWG